MPLIVKIVIGVGLAVVTIVLIGLAGYRQIYLANHPESKESE